MWLFTKKSFLSIVQHRDKPGVLLVRARVKGDIERYFPEAVVEEGTGTDYQFRAFLPREEVQKVVGDVVRDIDYDNYKANIEDHERRAPWYHQIWHVMWRMQGVFLREPRRKK